MLHRTYDVFSGNDEKENLAKLNDMVNAGGEPIGFLMSHSDEELQVTSIAYRPLEEYAAEPWVREYLEALVQSMASLRPQGGPN